MSDKVEFIKCSAEDFLKLKEAAFKKIEEKEEEDQDEEDSNLL